MRTEGLDHLHLAVRNLSQAAAFFTKLTGSRASRVFESPDGGFRFQFVKAGPIVIQLMEPTSPDTPIAQFIEHRGEGVYALSFKVAALNNAIMELSKEGFQLIGKSDTGDIKQAHFSPKDTFGTLVELCDYPGKAGSIMDLFEQHI